MSRMAGENLLKRKCCPKIVVRLLFVVAVVGFTGAYPTVQEDELAREYPGARQLASWLITQIRRGDFLSPDVPVIPYRMPNPGKRNSAELTSSIMGIPRTMIDNGRKK